MIIPSIHSLIIPSIHSLLFSFVIHLSAKYHGIPFYVAAPITTIDFSLEKGSDIAIEERSPEELMTLCGIQIAATGIGCWNPAFDVTPAELITGGIITENGVFKPSELREKLQQTTTRIV